MNMDFCHVFVTARFFALLLVLACCLVPLEVRGFDIERFLELDRSEIRAAERQLDRLLDTYQQDPEAMSLNEAEQYVIERELYWRTAAEQAPQTLTLDDGSTLIKLHPAALNTTVLSTDENGLPILGCAGPRHGWQGREPMKVSPLKPEVVR